MHARRLGGGRARVNAKTYALRKGGAVFGSKIVIFVRACFVMAP